MDIAAEAPKEGQAPLEPVRIAKATRRLSTTAPATEPRTATQAPMSALPTCERPGPP